MKLTALALFTLIAAYGRSQDVTTPTPADSTISAHKDKDEKSEKNIHHEIGVNATYFMKQVFSLSSNTLPTQPYQLTYKLIAGKKIAGRLGIGADMSSQNTTVSGSTTPRQTNNSNVFGRIGVEYRKQVSRHFLAYAGIDFVTQLINSKTTTSTDPGSGGGSGFSQTVVTTDKNNGFGGGPVLGIQYYINKRMSLYTEMPITFLTGHKSETVSTTTINNGGGFGNPTTTYDSNITNSTTNDFSIMVPVTLYFAVKF